MTDSGDKITPQAAAFINWAVTEMEDPSHYAEAVAQLQQRVAQFYVQHDQSELVSRLHAKVIIGAQEHGEPFYAPQQLQTEIENEYVDLLGWMLIERWNKMKTNEES